MTEPPEPQGQMRTRILIHLAMLFLHPGMGMAVAQVHRIWKSVLLVIVLIACGYGCSAGVSSYRHYAKITTGIVAEIAQDVAPVRVRDGRLFWNPALPEDYQKTVGTFRIQISGHPAEVKSDGAQQGLLVTRNKIEYWNREAGDGGDFYQMTVVDDKKLAALDSRLKKNAHELQETIEGWSPDKGLDAAGMKQLCQLLCHGMFPLLMAFHTLDFLRSVFFCILIFVLSTCVFRTAGGRSLGDLALVAVNMSLPPSLIAWVWAAAAPRTWDFQSIYFVAFLIYMLFLYLDTRRFLAGNNGENPPGN